MKIIFIDVNEYSIRAGYLRLMLLMLLAAGLGCADNLKRGSFVEDAISESKADDEAAELKRQQTQKTIDSLMNRSSRDSEVELKRFDISVNQIPAQQFFMSLVADADTNIVTHPDVNGNITLSLNNVNIEEVLKVVRSMFGYEFKQESGIYTIFPSEMRTEIFPINYLNVRREGVTHTSVMIGKISSRNRSSSQSNSEQSESSSSGEEGGSTLSRGALPSARVRTTTDTNFWETLHQTLFSMVGGTDDGRMVMSNPQAGLVVVKAMPGELSDVREFLEKSELSVRRQVVLETKIIEVRLNNEFRAGINWGAISGQLLYQHISQAPGTLIDVLNDSSLDITSELTHTALLDVVDISKLISLLETQGNVHVLSSPRVSTVNNQKAVIRVGSDEFFVTGITNDTTSNASSTTSSPTIELDSFFSGIALDVTPQIAEDGDVILHIHPIVSEVKDQLKTVSVGQDAFTLPLAFRDVRETDSIVRAKNGQVIVLGGLMQESFSGVDVKQPLLGDVPILKAFFKRKEKLKSKTELVILLRPIVIDSDADWRKELDESVKTYQSMSKEK